MGKRKVSKRKDYFLTGFMLMIIIVVLIYGFFFAFSNKAKGYFYGNAIGQTYDLGD